MRCGATRWGALVGVLVLAFCGVAGAQERGWRSPRCGVRLRVGSTLALMPYLKLGGGGVYGAEGLASWGLWPKWDFELGVGGMYGAVDYPLLRLERWQGARAAIVPISVAWCRWIGGREQGWHYRAGVMLGVQVWGYRWSREESGMRYEHLPVGYVLNLEEEGVKLTPLVPTLTFAVGYRWPGLPLEVGLEAGRDLLFRLEPFSKNPIFSLVAASYVGGAVAWWF